MNAKSKSSLDKVMKNLNKEIKKIQGRTMSGLISATILIRRDMDKTAPTIPVDTGNLRQSWFVTTSNGETPSGSSPSFKDKKDKKTGRITPLAADVGSNHSRVLSSMSGLARSEGSPHHPILICGFSANYAVFVHENEEADVDWKRPNSGPKFFEGSIKRNQKRMLEIIRDKARIK